MWSLEHASPVVSNKNLWIFYLRAFRKARTFFRHWSCFCGHLNIFRSKSPEFFPHTCICVKFLDFKRKLSWGRINPCDALSKTRPWKEPKSRGLEMAPWEWAVTAQVRTGWPLPQRSPAMLPSMKLLEESGKITPFIFLDWSREENTSPKIRQKINRRKV